MITAADIMEKKVITLSPETDITTAVEILINNHINGIPVVDENGSLKGILCQSDLIFQQKELPIPPILTILDGIIPLSSSKKFEKEFQKTSAVKVKQAMATDVVTVKPDTPLKDIAALMVKKHFHTIPVVENNKIAGIIGKEDVLKTLMV
ncbi:MAG: CBS domain-containing protein [Thermodesulfobacteriota bacterium]|nr:CBS domain-containing protein [Thermodesulfobacteriota bacterium]